MKDIYISPTKAATFLHLINHVKKVIFNLYSKNRNAQNKQPCNLLKDEYVNGIQQ